MKLVTAQCMEKTIVTKSSSVHFIFVWIIFNNNEYILMSVFSNLQLPCTENWLLLCGHVNAIPNRVGIYFTHVFNLLPQS